MEDRKKKESDDLSQIAYDGIRKMLFHNEILPGQKIAYRDLAKRFEMSITPVTHALKWLELQNLVRRVPNKGYYAESISLQQIGEVYDLRIILETSLLPKIIERLDQPGIDRLSLALEASLESLLGDNLSEKLIKDMDFHLTLAALSDCRTQQTILGQLYDLLYLKYRSSLPFATSMKVVKSDHSRIAEAVISKDLKTATEVLNKHISKAKEHAINGLKKALKEKETSTPTRYQVR
jgi:DNA-binding GntR family transcriptional regulator